MFGFITTIYNSLYSSLYKTLWGNLDDSNGVFTQIMKSPNVVVPMSFGLFGGKVAVVKPNHTVDMASLFNEFDSKEIGRPSAKDSRFFVPGLITTRDGPIAVDHHNLLSHTLNKPSAYIENTKKAVELFLDAEEEDSIPLLKLAALPMRSTISNVFFGKSIPKNLQEALQGFSELIQDKLDNFGKILSVKLMGVYYSWFFSFVDRYQQAKLKYQKAAEEFLLDQAEAVISEFQQLKKGENLQPISQLSNVVAKFVAYRINEKLFQNVEDKEELIEHLMSLQKDDLLPYLEEEFVKSLPVLSLPGDMIVIPICSVLTELAQNPQLVKKLRVSLIERDYMNKTPEEKRLDVLDDAKKKGLAHQLYLESLRREYQQKSPQQLRQETVLWRYCKDGLDVKDKDKNIIDTIEPNTLVAVLNALPRFDETLFPQPERFDPSRFSQDKDPNSFLESTVARIFSEGMRSCPAKMITKFIFQEYVAQLVMKYDMELINGDDLMQAKIKLTPISLQLSHNEVP